MLNKISQMQKGKYQVSTHMQNHELKNKKQRRGKRELVKSGIGKPKSGL